MLPQWALNLGPQPFGSDAVLLSYWGTCYLEDLRSVYGHALSSCAGTKDNLRISQVAHALIAQRGEHETRMTEVLGSVLTWVNIFAGFFVFAQRSLCCQYYDYCQFCVCVKNSEWLLNLDSFVGLIAKKVILEINITCCQASHWLW